MSKDSEVTCLIGDHTAMTTGIIVLTVTMHDLRIANVLTQNGWQNVSRIGWVSTTAKRFRYFLCSSRITNLLHISTVGSHGGAAVLVGVDTGIKLVHQIRLDVCEWLVLNAG